MGALRSEVDWYDRTWTDGVCTRSAELYGARYEEFHNMAQTLESAFLGCREECSEPAGNGIDLVSARTDIFIVATSDGFRIFAGEAAGRMLRYTVYEASRGPGTEPAVQRMRERLLKQELDDGPQHEA